MCLLLTCTIFLLLLNFILLVGIYQKNTNAVCMSGRSLEGRTALVTGGTAGMGLEIARELAQRGARVIIAAPAHHDSVHALRTLYASCPHSERILYKPLDLASFQSTRSFAADILASEPRLDIVVHNAGVGGPRTLTSDGLNLVMQVNYYGPFLLTILLLPLLKKSGKPGDPSRIVSVASAIHWLGTLNHNSWRLLLCTPYANSKLCLVLFSRELTKRLKGSSVVINNADPGAVGTQIFVTFNQLLGPIVTFLFRVILKNSWQGAQTAIHLAMDKQAGAVSGEYFRNCKQIKAAKSCYDNKLALKLWEETVSFVKLTELELKNL